MARLSTTDCKRLENAIVGAHILAGVQEAKNMDVYGEPNFQGRTAKCLVKYTHFIGVCSTDTSVAYPEICERTAQARISLMSSSFIPPRQQWAPNAHLQ